MTHLRPTPIELQKNNDMIGFFERIRQLFEGAKPVADLGLTITDPPTQADVQAISDKVDELLTKMRAAEQMEQ